MISTKTLVCMVLGAVMAVPCAGWGQVRKIARPMPANAPAGGNVNLPYTVADNAGNQYFFYQSGQFQQQGNMPIYSQAAMLQISGQYPQARNNQASVDPKTGEIIFEKMTAPNVEVTRRILVNKEEGWVRYIDIIKNPSNNEQSVNLVWTTNLNYGTQMAQLVADPRKKDQNIAWVAQTHMQGRSVVELFAGKSAKTAPTFQYQPNNSAVSIFFNPTIGAGKEIAVMHFHLLTNSMDAGQRWVMGLKESKLMASVPPAIRRLIVNFRGGENFIGDYEILRGDILDVVELRSGDQLKGTLKEKTFKLATFYGNIEVPVEKVIGMINAGEFRPRQLLITTDGEVFGGQLDHEKISLELSSGQLAEIPLSQITRLGYHKRSGEPEEWNFDKPVVFMRSGDRIGVQLPTTDVQVATRYGQLKLAPQAVAAIDFQSEENGVHEIFLTDGSKFAGLVNGDTFEMKLSGEGPEQSVKFPASSIRRLQLAKVQDPDAQAAVINLTNDDMLVGSLTGALKLDTAFTTLALGAGEIKKLVHSQGSPSDVQVVLWDDTSVSGQLEETEVTCQLKSGVTIKVPVALVEDYSQPRPTPSAAVIEGIKRLVLDLNADDWKQRNAAQEKLIAMGPVVISTLQELKANQSPEAQERIGLVLKALEGTKKAGG